MKARKMVWSIVACTLGFMLLLAVSNSTALADNVYVCQSCTSAPSAPTLLTNVNSITVGVAGSATMQNPLLIVLGVVDGTSSTTAPTISFSGCGTPAEPTNPCSLATVGTYGLTSNQASFTSSSSGTAFSQLGLSAGGSQNFGNWSTLGKNDGFGAPTSFELFAYELPTTVSGQSPITIDESGAPLGSYIIGYSCKNGTATGTPPGACAQNGDRGDTPFTTSGVVDSPSPAPEPSSLVLLGIVALGFAALGVFGRDRLRASR
ncbi:MAG: PEP-CTERM sorting domain-containing protein [Terriglobia bacterium]